MKQEINQFNIRVYALIINERKEVLICDECHNNMEMTKFPGGGLQFGEGTIDCLKREAIEEFGQDIEIIEHFYTTDFFQKALFYKDHQLISIYYRVLFKEIINFKVSHKPFDFDIKNGNLSFRWCSIDEHLKNTLTFPIDKYVGGLLHKKLSIQ